MIQNITNVRGIKCWGAHTGVKSMRRDLAIFYSEKPAVTAATFTQNQVVAEPVKITRENLQKSNHQCQLLVVNSGNANAMTGEQGKQGALAMMRTAAEGFSIQEELVMIASTGIIGQEFPTENVVDGIRENIKKVTSNSRAGSFAANAILTTDTFPKEGFVQFELEGKEINIGGVAKGSGMIHPNMATMLAFTFTDINIKQPLLDLAFKRAVNKSFNMITVDGDTSTNDMASVMANGMAGNTLITEESDPGFALFSEKLEELMIHLAKLIVSDGEGASKFIEYRVKGAKSEAEARQMIRVVSDSSLVKTAMFGRDANWGRVLAAMGRSGVPFDPDKVDLHLGNDRQLAHLLDKGTPVVQDVNYLKRLLKPSDLQLEINLNLGEAKATGWGTDLTTDYVMFNSVYTT